MDLGRSILERAFKENCLPITQSDIEKLFEKECYRILDKIKAVLEDEYLDDKACFEKIEMLVCLFDEIGGGCGGRHIL